MASKYDAYLRPTWWTIEDAANVICGFVPPERPFDMELYSGGDRALLYFELKSRYMAEHNVPPSGKYRIRPAVALRVARDKGIEIPSELIGLLVADEAVPMPQTSRDHVPDKLAHLNQASAIFWRNAKQDDPDTQPKSERVIAWLVDRGYSASLAEKAASIIRPDWAFKGRPETTE